MDCLRLFLNTAAGLMIVSLGIFDCSAHPVPDLVVSGRLLSHQGQGGSLVVRLRCPQFQAQTRTTESGLFAVRVPRTTSQDFLSLSTQEGWRSEELSFSDLQARSSMECSLQILRSSTILSQLWVTLPRGQRHIDIGDLEIADTVTLGSDKPLTVHWASLAAPPEANAACAQARNELGKQRPNLEKANQLIEKALHLDPEMKEAWYLKAFAAMSTGNFEAAREASERVHSSNDRGRFPNIAVVDALLLAQDGKVVEAASLLRSFLSRNPGYENRAAVEKQIDIWAPTARTQEGSHRSEVD